MKLSSKNSFLKRIACIILSAMLCLTSFTLSGFAPTLEAEAATNANITVSGYGVLIGDQQNRINDNALTIVNDQQNANFSVGFVEFDLSSLDFSAIKENGGVKSANYTFTYSIDSSEREAMGLSCYYSTQNDSELVGTGAKIYRGTAKDAIFTGDDGDHISRAVSHFGLEKIADFDTTAGRSATYTVDLSTMVNYAIQNNQTEARLIIMLKQPGVVYGPDWSDTIVTISKEPFNVYTASDVNITMIRNLDAMNIANFNGYTGVTAAADNSYTKDILVKNVTQKGESGSAQPAFSDEMENVLYTYGTTGSHQTQNTNNSDFGMQFGDIVFLYYDNATLACPINTYFRKSSGTGKRRFRGIYPTSSSFELRHSWHGENKSNTYATQTSNIGGYSSSTCTDNTYYTANTNSTTTYHYSNTLYYKSKIADGITYISEQPKNWHRFNNNGDQGAADFNVGTVYAVNYNPIKRILNTVKSDYAEVKNKTSNYTADSLYDYLTLVTAVVAFDFSKYDFSNNTAVVADNCGRDIAAVAEAYTKDVLVCNHDYSTVEKIETKDDEDHILQKHQKTCSRCNDVLVENHKFTITGTTASCSDNCGYSVSSDYKSNGFRITTGNLFDFDAYANKPTSTNMVENKGTSYVDIVNDTITVAGSARDAYTYYSGNENCYTIPIIGGNTYTFSYVPSKSDNQAFVFFYKNGNQEAPVGDNYTYKVIINGNEASRYPKNTDYYVCNYSANPNIECKIKFTAPEDCTHVDFRFGTVESGAICTFSDISFYECDENGNPTNGYEVLAHNVPSGKKVLESFDFPTADKCKASYDMKEKDGEIGPEHIIDTNLNITFDPNHSYDSREVNGNTLTIKCSVCQSTYTIDLTAYNSAVTQAQASIADVKVYTNTSRTELSNVLTKQEELFSSAKTQNEVNACATAIVTANKIKDGDNGGLLEYLTYNVTFIIQDETSSNTVIKIKEEPHHYGDIVNMNVDEGNVYKWTKTTINSEGNPVEIKYADNATSTSYVVNENATIIAYLSPVQEASTTNVKIILKDKTDRISGIAYATNGTITLNDTYIAVGDTKLYSKSVTYYNAKGYTINGVVVSGQYTIPEGVTEIVLRPIYVAGSTLQIDCDTATSINGKNVTSYQAKWDEPITIKASGEVIWYTLSGDKEIILAQGDTYKFRANESIKIYTKDVTQTNVAPSVKIGYFDYDVELNKVTVVNNFFVPSGMNVKSAGVILSTKTNDIETLKKQTGGRFSVTPDKFTENGNQVRISVSRTANTPFTMHALAYVEFQDGTVCYADEIATCQYSPKQV